MEAASIIGHILSSAPRKMPGSTSTGPSPYGSMDLPRLGKETLKEVEGIGGDDGLVEAVVDVEDDTDDAGEEWRGWWNAVE